MSQNKNFFRGIFLFLSMFVGLSVQAYQDPDDVPDGEHWFAEVQTLIKNKNITSTSELLRSLPADLKTRYILMFKSRSLQQADYLNPRVLLIAPASTFVMTFNGDESQAGFESVETMRYTERRGRPEFIFEEIAMSTDLQKRVAWLENNGKDTESVLARELRQGPNAPLCLKCHRQDPRPNWDHYSFWPGAYGQHDSQLYIPSFSGHDTKTGESIFVDNREPAERLPTFVQRASTHSRYQNLLNLTDYAKVNGDFQGRQKNKILFDFTAELSRLNFRRIGHLLHSSSHPRLNTLLFVSATSFCDLDKADIPAPIYERAPKVYSRLEANFTGLDFPWRDTFMNFVPGPGNGFITPGFHQQELLYEMSKYESSLEEFLGPVNDVPRYGPNRQFRSDGEFKKGACTVLKDRINGLRAAKPL